MRLSPRVGLQAIRPYFRRNSDSAEFRGFLAGEGIEIVRLPARSPNLNAFSERFVRSIKEECLARMIFFRKASLQHAITQYMEHYHGERNHQGRENRLLRPHAVDRDVVY